MEVGNFVEEKWGETEGETEKESRKKKLKRRGRKLTENDAASGVQRLGRRGRGRGRGHRPGYYTVNPQESLRALRESGMGEPFLHGLQFFVDLLLLLLGQKLDGPSKQSQNTQTYTWLF